jgi:hypothetical protein
MMIWQMLHPKMRLEMLGLIPGFLDDENPAPAAEQIDKNYRHGGGWFPYPGFKLAADNWLISNYQEDPPLRPLAQTKLRDELVVFYDHAWVAIIQPDRSFEVARID